MDKKLPYVVNQIYNRAMPSGVRQKTSAPWTARFPFFYGWVMLGVAGLAMFTSGPGQTYAVSLFVNPMIEDLGWSRTTMSGLYTAGSLTAAATMFLVGRLLDRYGARVMLPVVVVLFGFALIFMGHTSQQWHLFAGFALIRALGQGSLTLMPTTLIALWFVRLRGRVMALNSLGAVASQAAFPPLIHLLISAFGWRSAWVVLALIVWGLLLIPAVLLIRRSPESVGLLPDGTEAPSEQQVELSSPREVNFTLSEALKTRTFWLLILAGSSQSLIGTALVFHHVSVMDSGGLDAVVAASALSVIAPGALLGTFLAGFLCDRFPNRFVLVGGQLILVFAMLLILVMAHPWQALVYGGLLGLGGGILMTTAAVIWPNYYGREHLGAIRGVVTSAMVASAALGPLPFGFLFDVSNSYTWAVLIFLTLPIACAIAAFMATTPQRIQPRTV
jgi:MFS family permease